MAEILQSPQHFPSSSSSTILVSHMDNDGLHQQQLHQNIDTFINFPESSPVALYRGDTEIHQEREEEVGEEGVRRERKKREREEGDQLSLLTVLVTVFRKSLVACKSEVGGVEEKISSSMEISWPTNVRHVSHVTFDRFNGFLGLPVEFEPEVPRRPPSASTRVFGVSTVSMQLSFDTRGNSVPTILLMMQRRLYTQGGLQAEGIFRINPENGQEEYVREQLNRGVVPDDVDVHCLAGLIKAWFRELPTALLDCLPPDQVMQAQSEEECTQLVRNLPPTEAALLDWAINLMADVAQLEHHNKMNARNIAMVFAPNMTQMADPLTALMFAVQVMNFLKTLIEKTLRDREDSIGEIDRSHGLEPSDENGDHGASLPITYEEDEENEEDQLRAAKDLYSSPASNLNQDLYSISGRFCPASNLNQDLYSISGRFETVTQDEKENIVTHCPLEDSKHSNLCRDVHEGGSNTKSVGRYQSKSRRTKSGQSSDSSAKKTPRKIIVRPMINVEGNAEKEKETSIISRINTQAERVEAWR